MHTNESDFYRAGLWDGVMNCIESFWDSDESMQRGSLFQLAKEVVPNILQGDSQEFLKKYFPKEIAFDADQ